MTLIDRDGVPVAALLHDPSLEDEPELLAAATAGAGIALENARLHVELRARLEELRGSRARMVDVANKERQRLERNLHDGAQQRLVALSLELSLLERRAAGDARRRRSGSTGPGARSRPRSRSSARSPGGSIRRSSAGTASASRSSSSPRWRPVPVRLTVEIERAAARGGRGGGVLPRLREPRERRQVRAGVVGDRGRQAARRLRASSR